MVKYKNEKGLTFIALVITIILLLIIATVSVNIGLGGIENTIDKENVAILYMVQQAVLGQHSKAYSLRNNEDLTADDYDKIQYYGTKIYDLNTINMDKMPDEQKESLMSKLTHDTYYDDDGEISDSAKNEDFYYRLETNDLKKLKIYRPGDSDEIKKTNTTKIVNGIEVPAADEKNVIDTFIVNYKSGKVYNETKQITSKKKILYVEGISKEKSKKVDNTSFVD